MSGAAEAGIVSPHQRGDAVEHTFLQAIAVDEMLAHLAHAVADGAVVMSGGDDQVGPDDGAVFVDLVMMDEGAARRLDHAYALQGVDAGGGADVGVEDVGLLQQQLHALQGVHHLDQAGVVIEERAVGDPAKALAKFRQLGVGARRAHGVGKR